MSLLRSTSVFPRRTSLTLILGILVGGLVLGVVGCDGGGTSDEPPSRPSGVEATSQDGAVRLTWDRSSAASGYNVYRDTSSQAGIGGSPVNGDTPVGQASFTDESVVNGTRYFYRVTAVGDGGESDPSSEVSARPFPGPPDRP